MKAHPVTVARIHAYPRRFPLSRVRFNPPETWAQNDLRHDMVMSRLESLNLSTHRIAWHHFHPNEDGTLTPLMRAHEWELAAMRAMGRKTFRLG